MPFVQVSAKVQLHYEISYCESGGSESSLRPWLMIVHPLLMDSSYVKSFSDQSVIRSSFNQILFDARHHGRSKNPPSKAIDLFTLAADFAIGLEKLQIPAVHALGTHCWSSEILLRMAAVFPTKVISLCLCSIPPPTLEPYIERAFQECFDSCAYPESVEEWDEGVGAVQWFNFGDPSLIDRDILDEWASVLVRRIPPSRSIDCCLCVWPFLGACKVSKPDHIPDGLRSEIKLPILILRGANNTVFTEAGCQGRLNELPAHEYSKVKTIEDAPLLCTKTHPKETAVCYMDWVKEILDGKYSKSIQAKSPTCWKSNLEKLALYCKNESIVQRDPFQSDSYNRNTKEEVELFGKILADLSTHQVETFSLFGGRAPERWTGASFKEMVPWRFSSRFDEARLSAQGPVLQHSKHDCEVEEIQIKTSVEVCSQDLVGL
ncbi:hypothetical protein PGT21_019861 [Puccinia graminis f. sp. tritici]|uniref:AB hydrolase-1 domain-containing protein n=1 Tax=Puccinia graminis f. sp. tritici TaxID=56615 RepID=A0A5B0RG43_PUCGR|nr:hypothetical protein PGT21_019861 [Puccinia graminis f. sp. tritici]KAA1124158.1 hypothetical protein PGTUg99_030564 [Puccinia graminis f. sp. tritici]